MSSDVLERAREKIDAEILILQERIRSLRSSRNALSLIHRLPPEVMVQIFVWLQSLYRGKFTDLPSCIEIKSLQTWLRVTHVSRHWRNIAQSCKTLYSTIPTLDLGYAREMLKASGSAPLSIIDRVNTGPDGLPEWDQDLQELLISALPRTRNLWLGPWSEKFLLTHFKTSNLDLDRLYIWGWENITRTMLPNSLRHLHLYWSPLESYEWLSSLSNVVWLHLSYSFANAGREVAVDTILNVLDGMPQLVSLELLYMFHSASPEVERISPITAQLQDLKLSDNLHTVIKFLPWLSFAPRFTIDIRLSESNAPAFSTNCPLLFTQLGHHLKASLMVIRIADFSLFRLGVTCFEGVGESPCLQLYSILRIDDIDRSWIKNADELPLAAVEALTTDALWSAADWGNSRWHNIPTLRRLTLGNDQTSSAFLHHLVAEGQRSSEHIPFASLEELSLHGLNYGRNLKLRVQTTLAERMERGAKLRKLAFRDCKVSEDSIKQLSKVVDVVEQHTSEKKRAKKEKRTT